MVAESASSAGRLAPAAARAWEAAQMRARRGSQPVGIDHVLHALLEPPSGEVADLLGAVGVDRRALLNTVDDRLWAQPRIAGAHDGFHPDLTKCAEEARALASGGPVHTSHLLIALASHVPELDRARLLEATSSMPESDERREAAAIVASPEVPVALHAHASGCEKCGATPARTVHFHRHIGLIVVFMHSRLGGRLCRACMGETFTSAFLVTLLMGWWGWISFFATLFFLPYNLVVYLLARGAYTRPEDGGDMRFFLALGAGFVSVLGLVVTVPVLLVIWAASWASSLDSAEPPPEYARVCDGTPIAAAPDFDPHASMLALGYASDSGWVFNPRLVPEDARAEVSAELVVCAGPEREEAIEQCPAPEGRLDTRLAFSRTVEIRAARTAEVLATADVTGGDAPPPCDMPLDVPSDLLEVRRPGSRVQTDEIAATVAQLMAGLAE